MAIEAIKAVKEQTSGWIRMGNGLFEEHLSHFSSLFFDVERISQFGEAFQTHQQHTLLISSVKE